MAWFDAAVGRGMLEVRTLRVGIEGGKPGAGGWDREP